MPKRKPSRFSGCDCVLSLTRFCSLPILQTEQRCSSCLLPALQIFGGAHLSNYFSLQANYVWRRNDLSISSTAPTAGNFYVESRNSSQQGFILDALVYFRPLTSRIRPYLAVGAGFVRFESSQTAVPERGSSSMLPPLQFSSIKPVFDSPVGIDLAITKRLAFRYSFAETLRHNDISDRLSPPGKRILADYQNLFGVVFRL